MTDTTHNTPANGGQILTEAMLSKAGRALADRNANLCNVNSEDNWCLYSSEFIEDARTAFAAIEADLRASLAANAVGLPPAPHGFSVGDNVEIPNEQFWGYGKTAKIVSFLDRGAMVMFQNGVHKMYFSDDLKLANSPTLAAPAIPAVDRNSILEEAAALFDQPAARYSAASLEPGIDPETRNVCHLLRHELLDMQKAIRALKSAALAVPTVDRNSVLPHVMPQAVQMDDEPTDREALIACLQDDAAKLADANPDDEMAQTMREAAAMLESDEVVMAILGLAAPAVVEPAAQVAASEDQRDAARYRWMREPANHFKLMSQYRWGTAAGCDNAVDLERATPATVKTAEGE